MTSKVMSLCAFVMLIAVYVVMTLYAMATSSDHPERRLY